MNRHDNFPSQHVTARPVEVWCPEADMTRGMNRYPVIYMHDGQNLFDPNSSFIGVDWGMGEAMTRLMRDMPGTGAIIVGIWNSPLRWREYMPQKPLATLGWQLASRFVEQAGGEPLSAGYLKFLVEELKPFIDATYPTLPDQSHTFVMGSSMGGLISLYALCRYPWVFGLAGCLSTHFPIGAGQIEEWMRDHLPQPGNHRLYFDYGGRGIDREYGVHHLRVHGFLDALGWREGSDYLIRRFPSAAHNERAWRKRLHVPLRFLFPEKR